MPCKSRRASLFGERTTVAACTPTIMYGFEADQTINPTGAISAKRMNATTVELRQVICLWVSSQGDRDLILALRSGK